MVGSPHLAAKGKLGTTLFEYDAPLAAILAGGLTAAFVISLVGPVATGSLRWLLSPAAGFCGAPLLAALGGLSAFPDFVDWDLLLGVFGGFALVLVVHNRDNALH